MTADDYPHRVSLTFEYDEESLARVVSAAVGVEEGDIDDDRSAATVTSSGRRVTVDVGARDLVALRAGVNTWIRLVETAERVAEVVDESARI